MQTTDTQRAEQSSLFHRLGGAAPIAHVVAALYERVRADPELDRYFHATGDITPRDFSLLCGHLIDVLTEAGIPTDDADDVLEWVMRARNAVITD